VVDMTGREGGSVDELIVDQNNVIFKFHHRTYIHIYDNI
jgi:hypothetical protein